MNFDPTDSEIALYDSFRVDVFRGARDRALTSVVCFSLSMQEHFLNVYLPLTVRYLEELWEHAEPMEEPVSQIRDAIEASDAHIDYTTNWLIMYEYSLPPEDDRLKQQELDTVVAFLREIHRWGRIRRMLDIGTCTARYPIRLREAVVRNGSIVAIDNDPDCLAISRHKVGGVQAHGDLRIDIRDLDFTRDSVRYPFTG